MLKKIICDKFREEEIDFYSGLNVILGDNIASNSIGKSTMLMIIDFVYGGNGYIKINSDVMEHLGHHTIKFVFKFDEIEYFFYRKTDNYLNVYKCDEKHENPKIMDLSDFKNWLQEKYACEIPYISFREIVGRYSRIYGKENLKEKKPLTYYDKEKNQDSVYYLTKLFEKYSLLKSHIDNLKAIEDKLSALNKAKKNNVIIGAKNKTEYKKNEKEIKRLEEDLDEIKKSIATSTNDIEALITEEIYGLKNEKTKLIRIKGRYNYKLQRTRNNINGNVVNFNNSIDEFMKFFPNFNKEMVDTVDDFHKGLSKNLTLELEEIEKELLSKIKEINAQIEVVDNRIMSKLSIKDVSKIAVDKVIGLTSEIKKYEDRNKVYDDTFKFREDIKTAKKVFETIRTKVYSSISTTINSQMIEYNNMIYGENHVPPNLMLKPENNSYVFTTSSDRGTGASYAGLIELDLALLTKTRLPILIHDLPLFKNIEDFAMSIIIELYSKSVKQIFIALDKANMYNKESQEIINNTKVVSLSKSNLLFIKNWKDK